MTTIWTTIWHYNINSANNFWCAEVLKWYLRVDPKLCMLCYLCYAIYAMLSLMCDLCNLRYAIFAILSMLCYIYACYYATSAVRQAPVDNACSSALHLCYQGQAVQAMQALGAAQATQCQQTTKHSPQHSPQKRQPKPQDLSRNQHLQAKRATDSACAPWDSGVSLREARLQLN